MVAAPDMLKVLAALAPRWFVEAGGRMKKAVRGRNASRRFEPLLAELYPSACSHELLVTFPDSAVFRIKDADAQGAQTILKVASNPVASERLAVEAAALDELAQLTEIGEWRSHVATVLDRGVHTSGTWFSQSAVAGTPISVIDADLRHVNLAACAALRPLHAVTSRTVALSEDVLDQLVAKPLHVVQRWRPQVADGLAAIGVNLRQQIPGQLAVSRLHGDFAPTNVLWDVEAQSVSGIIDWSFGQEHLPPEIDFVQFGLALISQRRETELGATVIWLLTDGVASPEASLILASLEAGPNEFDLSTGVTLTWLHHVSHGLSKAYDLRKNPVWLLNNIDQVVDALRPHDADE